MITRKITITKPSVDVDFPSESKELNGIKKQYEKLLKSSSGFKSLKVEALDELTQVRTEIWESAKDLSDFKFETSKLTDLSKRKEYVNKNKIQVEETLEIE